MKEIYDAVVIGGGVVGASATFHLKNLGCARVALVERGQICTGGTAKSCAIIRSHYSIPTNTQLTLQSLEIFTNFAEYLSDGEADCGFVNSGYLILAPAGDLAERLTANLALQAGVGADTFTISRADAQKLHPWLTLDDVAEVGYEPNSGYADPYLTTAGFIRAARRLGAVIKTDSPVTAVLTNNGRITGIRTAQGQIHAGMVLSAIGPWTALVARATGIELPLDVSRHTVLTFKAGDAYTPTLPIVKDLTTANKMYFRPSSGGVVLVGTGDHGDPVDTPDDINENVTLDFVALQSGQIAARMPGFTNAALTASWTGPYDITPDWNPVLGSVPGLDGLHIAYGFSGHGFKLAPAVGKVSAQAMLGLDQDIDMTPYRLSRFGEGKLLLGTYGVGSIS